MTVKTCDCLGKSEVFEKFKKRYQIYPNTRFNDTGLYSQNILKRKEKFLVLYSKIFLTWEAFESNTTFDSLNHTLRFTKLWRTNVLENGRWTWIRTCLVISNVLYREYVNSVAAYQKYLTMLGELIILSLGEKIIISPIQVRLFWYTTTLCTYSIYLTTSDLLSFIVSNTNKHDFSSIWKWISCCNDVMNNAECVIKRDVYPPKFIHVLTISVGYQFLF